MSIIALNCNCLLLMNSACPLAVTFIQYIGHQNWISIDEFADFLGTTVPKFDRLLLLGDLCCDSNLPSKVFLSLVHSFDFKQVVNAPINANEHILDLVFSYGPFVSDTLLYTILTFLIINLSFFNVSVPIETSTFLSTVCQFRRIDFLAHANFITAFEEASISASLDSPLHLSLYTRYYLVIFAKMLWAQLHNWYLNL